MNTPTVIIDITRGLRLESGIEAEPTPATMAKIMEIWTPLAMAFQEEFKKADIDGYYWLQWRLKCCFFYPEKSSGKRIKEPKFNTKATIEVCTSRQLARCSGAAFSQGFDEVHPPSMVVGVCYANIFGSLPTDHWRTRPRKFRNGFRHLTLKRTVEIYSKTLIEETKKHHNNSY